MKPQIPLTEFKQDRNRRRWQARRIKIATGIMIIFTLGMIFFSYYRLNQKTEAAVALDVIATNYKTCGTRVIYGPDDNPYVYKHNQKIYLKEGGCK